MRNKPLAAFVVAKQFRTRHKEDSPATLPAFPVPAVGGLQYVRHCGDITVHVLQPGVAGFLVMSPIPQPVLTQFQMLLAIQQQTLAWHDAA